MKSKLSISASQRRAAHAFLNSRPKNQPEALARLIARNAEKVRAQTWKEARDHYDMREKIEALESYILNHLPSTGACTDCDWRGDEPEEDKCPECGSEGTMTTYYEFNGFDDLKGYAVIDAILEQSRERLADAGESDSES